MNIFLTTKTDSGQLLRCQISKKFVPHDATFAATLLRDQLQETLNARVTLFPFLQNFVFQVVGN